jgi:gas vesicle protein
MKTKEFWIGLCIGVVIGAAAIFLIAGNHWEIRNVSGHILRTNSRTGETWQLENGIWVKISNAPTWEETRPEVPQSTNQTGHDVLKS